jgi:glycosyltransferase involved in cell wall biosynthesis
MSADEAPAVLHVTAVTGGGADRYVRSLAASTRRRHHVLHVGRGLDVLEDIAAASYLPLRDAGANGATALGRWSRAARIGIVHLHSVEEACRARLDALERATALPYVVTLHDLLFVNPRAFETDGTPAPDGDWIAGLAGTLERAAMVIAPSAFIRDVAATSLPRVRVAVVPPGIGSAPVAGTPPSPPEDFAAHAPAHVVAMIGAVGPHKGSGLIEPLASALEGSDITLVVIGYTDARLARGWVVPGRLYVHGPYTDDALSGWLAAYRAEAVLFPNRLPESFSYTLSEAWAAGLPVVVPDHGALGERVARHGGGWHLPPAFDATEAAALLRRLFGPEGAAERARVKSQITAPDAARVPTLEAMSREIDALYARFAVLPPDAGESAVAAEALAPLLAANLDGFTFRKELVRLNGELAELNARFAQSQQWNEKLEQDIAALNGEVQRVAAVNAELAEHKAALDQLPGPIRDYLKRRAQRVGR